jgi:hypothetical protein
MDGIALPSRGTQVVERSHCWRMILRKVQCLKVAFAQSGKCSASRSHMTSIFEVNTILPFISNLQDTALTPLDRTRIMVSTEVEARLRFLEKASKALAVTAPTVSSFMGASKREAASYHEVESTASGNVCDGCGQLLLIGWSCETVRTGDHKQTRQQRISGKMSTTKCVQCSGCGTENTIQHHKRRKTIISKPLSKVKTASSEPAVPAKQPIPTPLPEQTPAASPLPSKEQTPEITQAKPTVRRKARNKNASLQALLANKKPEAPKASGYGLDFMDFMK